MVSCALEKGRSRLWSEAREVYDRCREIFQPFGDGIFYVGEHGTGHLVKALNNLLSATTLASAAEATLVAQKGGVAPDKFLEIINAGNGRSYSTEAKFPRYILNRAFDDGFALGLMSKDLKIALQAAADGGTHARRLCSCPDLAARHGPRAVGRITRRSTPSSKTCSAAGKRRVVTHR